MYQYNLSSFFLSFFSNPKTTKSKSICLSMESSMKNLVSPFHWKTHFSNSTYTSSSSISSVLTLRDQTTPSVTSSNFVPRKIPTSLLLQIVTTDSRQITTKEDEYVTDQNLFTMLSLTTNNDVKPCHALTLAKKALLASREAADQSKLFDTHIHQILVPGLTSTSPTSLLLQEDNIVRSTRNLERRLKRRRVPISQVKDDESNTFRRTDLRKKNSGGSDPNDPLRFFLWGPETKKLLNAEEESKLILHIQDSLKLEEVKTRLQSQFNREPTLVEWSQVVGISCQDLQFKIRTGCSSREKLIYANLRMVVHIAKQYLGRGLSLQDLLQEGSMGLMKSVEKFKPQAGCRFASYAYWWIRQSIRKAIFHHSRTIRLPDSVYSILGKVLEAKKLYIQEAHRSPTKEELAQRVGITVEKLEGLLFSARFPLSIEQPVWSDQDTTFQEITADSSVEIPDVSVGKQIMRRHIRNLLNILSPREKRIIRLRYGIEGGERKSLSDIGMIYGLSKERVRQLESRAFYKLKQRLDDQGLAAYTDLLV